MYTDPETYKGYEVEVTGQVFADPEKDDNVSVKGIIKDKFEGKNAMGSSLEVPAIQANSVEVVDYITAVGPTVKSFDVNKKLANMILL